MHEGFLTVNIENNQWKNYYFKLEPTKLSYFEEKDSVEPKGCFQLEEVLSVHQKGKAFEMEIQYTDHSIRTLRANTR